MSDNTLNPSLVERAVKRLRDKIQQRTDLQDLKLMVDSWYALAHENADLLVAVKRMNEAMVEAEQAQQDRRTLLEENAILRQDCEALRRECTESAAELFRASFTFTQDEAYLLLRALDYCLNPERDMIDLREPHSEEQWKAVQAKVLSMSKGA